MASNRDGRELFRSLSRGEPVPAIILLHGEETFLVDEAVKAVGRAVLPDGGDDFSKTVLDGAEVTGQAIRQTLENLPLFGGRRLIHVRHIAAMNADELEALVPYLERPAPDTTLLLTDIAIDLRKRFFKLVKACKGARVIQFRPLYRNELSAWVGRRAKQKGLQRLDPEAIDLVVELTGPGLASMDSALDKLSLYVAEGARVSVQRVREVLDDTRSRTVFELTHQLGERDLAASLDSLARLLESGDSAVGMVAMIARHFRIVWRVRQGRVEGLTGADLARFAGCPPMFLREYERDAKRFDDRRLALIVQRIHDAERALKSSSVRDSLVMGQLVMSVCL